MVAGKLFIVQRGVCVFVLGYSNNPSQKNVISTFQDSCVFVGGHEARLHIQVKSYPETNMKRLVRWEHCTGSLNFNHLAHPVTCAVECTREGEVLVRFESIKLTRENSWLLGAVHDYGDRFQLQVVHAEVGQLISDDLFFTSIGTPSSTSGSFLELGAQLGSLDVRVPPAQSAETARKYLLRYHTAGMQGFHSISRIFDGDEVIIVAPSEVADFNQLAGQIIFRQDCVTSELDQWIARCDDRVLSVLRVMSLALGRFVDWSVREVYVDNKLFAMRFTGPKRHPPPAEPTFHFLHLEPALDLAIRTHHLLSDQNTAIGEAIDWLVPWHTFAEIRFLSAMTAFECLLARNYSGTKNVFDSSIFKEHIRTALTAVLADPALVARLGAVAEPTAVKAGLAELTIKIGNLNQLSLVSRLERFVLANNVPLEDLSVTIGELARARNGVVHGRRSASSDDDSSVTLFADTTREALRRTILALLNFEGQFHSYAGEEPEWRPFRISRCAV